MDNAELATQWYIFLDITIAILLGGIVGIEREWKQKPAGLRTNMIISAASALFISMGRIVVEDFSSLVDTEGMGVDPTRILHAVIVGVGFLGAGTILKSTEEHKVKYLTTSATIWFAAGIGITVGLKQYLLAASLSILMVVINILFDKVNNAIGKRTDHTPEED